MGTRFANKARLRLLVVPVAAAVALGAMSTPGAWAATGTVLYAFTGGSDGATPQGALVADSAGTLYGVTTHGGGVDDSGTVYQLTRSGSGWTETVIHTFHSADGSWPEAPLAVDSHGNLYGTAYQGGAYGHGDVFELSPQAGGGWTYSILYSFTGGTDGSLPADGVILDQDGNLYGTAGDGGVDGQGVVFQLAPKGSTGWTETVLHQFVADGVDGVHPGGRGTLLRDQAGNLYGSTVAGGSANDGVAYELSPARGTWTETLLHTFTGGSDGANPLGTLLSDASGNLYGTTSEGGTAGDGTVFKLTNSGSTWTSSVIYNFPGGSSGRFPYAGVIADPAGNLYGTTAGGVQGAGGVVYELSPSGGGWSERVLYTVGGAGNGSYGGLIRDSAGTLYGADAFGGPSSDGEVFAVTP